MKLKSSYLIALQSILFVLFLVLTSWFNRLAADDFYYIGELNNKSFIDVYKHLYFNWHGRWTSNFSQLISFKYYQIPYFLFLINFFSFSLLSFSIYQLAISLNNYYLLKLSKRQLISYSLIFLSVFFFCTVSPSSSWFWHTSTVVYIWSVIAFIAICVIIIKKATTPINYVILLLSSIYLGGSNEPLVAVTFILLGYSFYRAKRIKTIVSFVVILIAFLINYYSSGTDFRDGITPSLGFIDLLLYVGYGTLKFLLFTSYKTFLPAIILAFPFYLLGKKTNSIQTNFKVKNEVFISIIAIGLIVILNQFIVIYALGGLAPDRATTASSILISFVLVRYLFLLGQQHRQKSTNLSLLLLFNNIGLIIFIGATVLVHYRYAKAYDDRMTMIGNANIKETIIVKPLPFSGYIYSAEITNDSTHFSNQHIKSGLDLRQEIVLGSN